ncbi:hypothetical protein OG21DRAFT_665561 [Imleria badia]|nr:hypothetical protein OG21DRAFT_665561 [Imleria badia]
MFGLALREMSIVMLKGMGRAAPTADNKALAKAQRQSQNREMSNIVHLFEHLEPALGTHAERCDAVSSLSLGFEGLYSDTLDLSSPDSFRNLSKPMGALTPERCEIASSRYEIWRHWEETVSLRHSYQLVNDYLPLFDLHGAIYEHVRDPTGW